MIKIPYSEIKSRVEEVEGLDVLYEDNLCIETFDEAEDKLMNFYNPKGRTILEIFNFDESDLRWNSQYTSLKLYEVFEAIDDSLLMTIDKVYMLNTQEELNRIKREFECEIEFDMLGDYNKYISKLNIVIVNMLLLRRDALINPNIGQVGFDKNIFYNILLALRESHVANPVIGDDEITLDETNEDSIKIYVDGEMRIISSIIDCISPIVILEPLDVKDISIK